MALAEVHINEWQGKALASYEKAKGILDAHKGVDLPAEKETEYEAAMADYDRFSKRAAKEKSVAEVQSFIEAPIHTHPVTGAEDHKGSDSGEQRSVAEIAHSKSFMKFLRGGKGVLSPEERKAISSLSDPDGGALASHEFRAQLIAKRRDLVKIRSMATVIATTKQSISFPTFDYDDDIDPTIENDEITRLDPSAWTGKQMFQPSKLARIFAIPEELIEDSDFDVVDLLTSHFAVLFAEKEERLFLSGDGVNKPLGMEAAALEMKGIAGSTDAIAAEDVIDGPYDLREVYRGRGAAYLMHRNVIRKVRKLRADGSTGDLLWQPSLQAGQPASLNGFPLLESEFMTDATVGSDGDPMFIFGNFTFYWIVDRKELAIKRLVEKYAERDQIGIKLTQRVDAAPVLKDAFIRYNRK